MVAPGPPAEAAGIDVILRFHDPARLMELERAVFSLAGQDFRPIRILLVTQRFSAAESDMLHAALAPILAWAGAVELTLLNYAAPAPEDARAALANIGFAAAAGRYLALLDYDDVLYPEAYRLLTGQLEAGGAAIAFARTKVARVDVYPDFLHARGQDMPFAGRGLADLFRANFCPLHSYVIDRARVPGGILHYEPMLTLDEDYEMLIRLCAVAPADFSLLDTDVGLYAYKTDASNSYDRYGALPPAVWARRRAAEAFLAGRRAVTILAPDVQRALGLSEPVPGLTVQAYLHRLSDKSP
jgi:hypothetical protein